MSERLSRDEIIERIREQIRLLRFNAEGFDKGILCTTLQMATAIRVLFYDTNHSVSLIKHLCDVDGIDKNAFEMITTKQQHHEGEIVLIGDGLFSLSFGGDGFSCVPLFEAATKTTVPFHYWWNEEVVKNVKNGFEEPEWLSRKDIIRLHANKEGGAHVDIVKDEKISSLGSKEALGFVSYCVNQQGEAIEREAGIDAKKATIRQISFEVLESLYVFLPELFMTEYADPYKKALWL